MAAVVVPGPPGLQAQAEPLTLFQTTDPLLSNAPVVVFYGPASTVGATSSRVQVHIFTAAGHASYPRLAVSPNSPFYAAVSNLPREEQGDEVCRGLAFALRKYLTELSQSVKNAWCAHAKAPSPAALFGDHHVAILAARMNKVDNVASVASVLSQAFAEQRLPWQDVDVVLPPGSIKEIHTQAENDDLSDIDLLHVRYGRYADLVRSLGDTAFLPTSKIKRAPSRASSIGRNLSFLRHQKQNVRRELCELLETEESYVERLEELFKISTISSAGPQQLFPPSVSSILDLNSQFCAELRSIIEASENESSRDIDESEEMASIEVHNTGGDTLGIAEVAKSLCQWLAQFASPYKEYLAAHAECSRNLRKSLHGSDMTMAAELQEFGEQRLTSLLIEPVQRLPRYNLYIDGIMKQLPVRHPAIKHYLKARDLVSEICLQDDTTTDKSRINDRLRARVAAWPNDLVLSGRLVTVVDFQELQAPFTLESLDSHPGMLLLFTDCMVLLEKTIKACITARAMAAELESGLPVHRGERASTPTHELHFNSTVPLDLIDCTESSNSQIIHLLIRAGSSVNTSPLESIMPLKLEGAYEGKAARLVEEIVKAKVEGRFSEPERESPRWEVRLTNPLAEHCSLFTAIFEDSNSALVSARSGRSATRVFVDFDRHAHKPRAGEQDIRSIIALSPLKDGLWRLTVESVDIDPVREHIPAQDLAVALSKRVASLASARLLIDHPTMTSSLLERNMAVLQMLDLEFQVMTDGAEPQPVARERFRRPRSPVKLLSSFLSSTGPGSQPAPLLHKNLPPLPPPSKLSAPGSPSNKPLSRDGRPPARNGPLGSVRVHHVDRPVTPLKSISKLEETLRTYLLALQARKGNIVGRSLKMRATANELAVNELYNGLLEDPNMMMIAAQASVDVLFAAFEKFLNAAWSEQAGQILPLPLLEEIQENAETMFPSDFDDAFCEQIASMQPENQRAFKGIMKLLADLLDGTGNDADRGMLTAAFAEVLIIGGHARNFIPLIDRFVDDPDTYFGERFEAKPTEGSTSGHKRARSLNSSSVTSNTSSFRRKFGFSTITRSNSKVEDESKMAAVWRSLSKSTRAGDASPVGSISKASLHRSHSIDENLKPPSSRDGPVGGKIDGTTLGLSTIGEHPSFIPKGPPRKKRRSSLSDLLTLDVLQKSSPFQSPLAPRPPLLTRPSDDTSLLPSPIPSTPSANSTTRIGSPSRGSPRSRLPASFLREGSPGATQVLNGVEKLRPKKHPDEVTVTTRPNIGIPTLTPKSTLPRLSAAESPRAGLSERTDGGNVVKKWQSSPTKFARPKTPGTQDPASSRKLKMQSPQKLRERLQKEQESVSAAHTSLQQELSKIGNELTATPPRPLNLRASATLGAPRSLGQNIDNMGLAQRVLKMEGALPRSLDTLNTRLDELGADLRSSLAVSENKCKKLDELYREANSENEALYARFNEELDRILKVVRGGEGVEELKKQLKESKEETCKLKRETTRLKRENAGLRAQLKD